MEGAIEACQHCSARVEDPQQSLCPNCLNNLETRSFATQDGLERFREDRRAHGVDVPGAKEGSGRPGVAMLLAFGAVVMLLGAGGILWQGYQQGSFGTLVNSFGQAVMPLALGLTMAVAARKFGGNGS
jgi:hypothetical protein